MKDLLEALEIKLHKSVSEQISKAIDPLNTKIQQLDLKHAIYEAHFSGLEKRLNDAEQYLDDTEQYSPRACLRVYRIPFPKKEETATDCISKVKEVFKKIEVAVLDEAIDRVHRIKGKVKNKDTGEVRQAMIVKFSTWKHRTAVYKARKKSEDKKIQLDLTAKRAKLLSFAREKSKSNDYIEFLFADINCRIGLKSKVGTFRFLEMRLNLNQSLTRWLKSYVSMFQL